MQNTELFKKMMAGEIPCEKIYENEYVFAVLDINPVNVGHALVIPKTWSAGLQDASEETICHLFVAVQKVAKAVKAATNADAVNIIQNDGEAAGQKVFHLHIHVIPRFVGDGFEHWHGKPYASTQEVQSMAEKIRSVIR